jgi:glycogen(starch) synthase
VNVLTLSNLYPPDVTGGYELACSQVVEALRGLGHRVEVLTASPRRWVPPSAQVHRRLKLTEDRYWVAPDDSPDDLAMWLRDVESRFISAHNVHALLDALDEFAPDVVYLNNLVGVGGLGLLACLQFLGVPWVWHLGDCVPFDLCSARRGVVPALVREFSRGVEGSFLAVSLQLWNEIRSHGLDPAGRVEVAPYWVTGRREEAAARGREAGGPLRIVASGQVNRQKGADVLIEAAAILRREGRDDFLIDAFGAVTDPTIPPMIRKHGLDRHVRLMGPRPHAQVLDLYGDYDVLAFPTREREPFGIVPLEALSRGCVPVLTRRCGIAEWLVHGVHCLKAPRNAPAFARVFGQILDGQVALGPLARRGGEAVWRDFHLDVLVPRIEEALAAAARRPRRGQGTPAEAYTLSRLAERVSRDLITQAACG